MAWGIFFFINNPLINMNYYEKNRDKILERKRQKYREGCEELKKWQRENYAKKSPEDRKKYWREAQQRSRTRQGILKTLEG